ncbi:calcium-activated chloride channel-domain-containing protein [Chytridium lagenaria]|nr:calcium-activated chloride channel-domain-containing protein [Chytridium lagenaria]
MFHLHDDLEDPNCPENLRLFLKREWALRYFAYQPLDQISSYFGEKVALYFAFNGFYNLWLVSAVAVGLLRNYFSLGCSFDNSLTPWYGVFNSLWAMLMPSVWNRQANYLTWKWSTYDFEKEESKRPEFKATMTKRSEVTGRNELYFPAIKRRGRQIVSCLVIAIWVAVMAVFISFQISLGAYVSPSVNNDIWIACFTSFLGLASIFIMQVPFSIAVRWLNAWENYPTDTTYDDSFILKTYIFDFANSYSQPVYYSIVKPAFLSQDLFGLRFLNDSCSLQPQTENGSTCASGFTINLFVLFIGGQVVDRFQELCLPWIIARFLAIKASIKRRSRRLEERQRKRVAPMDITEDEGKPKVSEKATVLALSIDTLDDAVVSGRPSAYQRSVTKVKDNSNSAFLFGTSFKDMAAMVVDVVAGPTDVNGTADTGGENTRLPQYYRDDKLPEYRGVRDEYAQKIVQFGYVAMFVSINPLAPLFALLNNCYELRADAYKVLIMHQRPLPSRAQDIGSWEAILRFTARMSVATNSVQIAFTSAAFYGSFLAWLPSVGARMAARVGFIIAFHYAVYFITAILQWLIPEVPESVKLAMARTSYLDRLQRDQDVEVEDEFLSNPSLYSEKNVSEKRFDSQTTHEQLEARFFSALN